MFIDWVYDFVQVPVMVVTSISTGAWPQEENIKTLATICVQLKLLQTNLHSTIKRVMHSQSDGTRGLQEQITGIRAGHSPPYQLLSSTHIIMTLLP